MTWWDTDTWHRYEALCGDAPGTRARLLASAEWMTRVVELTASEAELWSGVRKSYKAIIHSAERRYIIGHSGVKPCQMLHLAIVGRHTRPIETWLMMQRWIDDGLGLAVVASREDEPRGFAYVVKYRGWSYYTSGGSLDKNVSHALIWAAIKILKAQGVRWLELGWLARVGDTEKDSGIARFKAGFPGRDMLAGDAPRLAT